MTGIIGRFILDIVTLMSSLIIQSLTLISQLKPNHVAISRFTLPFTILTAQARIYHSLFTGFLVIHHCHFWLTLCPAARASDAEHNLHHSPLLPKNLQWFPTVLGVKTRILTKKHTRPVRIFPTFPDTMANSSAAYTDPFSQFLFPPPRLCRMPLLVPTQSRFPTPHPLSPAHSLKLNIPFPKESFPVTSDPGQVPVHRFDSVGSFI